MSLKYKVGDRVQFVPTGTEHPEYQNLKGGTVTGVTLYDNAQWPYIVEFDNYHYGNSEDHHPCSEEELKDEV